MKIYAETPRLILREMTLADAEGMLALNSDPDVMKYIGTPVLTTIEENIKDIKHVRAQYEELGVGRLSVILKETGEFLGWSGLKRVTETLNAHVNYLDLGYRFIQKHWGKGYASEAAHASLEYGFNTFDDPKIYAIIMPANSGSRNVLEKSGLHYVNNFIGYNEDLAWFEISREKWENSKKR
jgi:RimJ/RimL family protein N-acetyltransferase